MQGNIFADVTINMFLLQRGGNTARWGRTIREHCGREPAFCDKDELAQSLVEGVIQPEWAAGVNGGDICQQEVSVVGMG